MADEIIQELWKIKDEIASEHGYNLDSLSAYLRSRTYSGHQLITDLQAVKVPAEQGATLNAETTRLYHHQ
jgi:hypothetical protein